MAERENIKERVRRINPAAWEFMEEFAKRMKDETGEDVSPENTIVLTSDMTPEEMKMVILENFLKQGLTLEEAEREAEEFYNQMQEAERLLDQERDKNNSNI